MHVKHEQNKKRNEVVEIIMNKKSVETNRCYDIQRCFTKEMPSKSCKSKLEGRK